MLMHSARLSDPLDPATKALKAVSSKRVKTEDDHQAVAEAEWLGSLYLDPDIGPFIPGGNITAALVAGAKLNKLGTRVTRGLLITTDVNPLAYQGPRDAIAMWRSGNFTHRASVVVSQARVMRTRPMFRQWATGAEGIVDESQLDLDQLGQIADNAGSFVGLGDWRPRFGRFTAKVEAL
jgi:hypothetical protein